MPPLVQGMQLLKLRHAKQAPDAVLPPRTGAVGRPRRGPVGGGGGAGVQEGHGEGGREGEATGASGEGEEGEEERSAGKVEEQDGEEAEEDEGGEGEGDRPAHSNSTSKKCCLLREKKSVKERLIKMFNVFFPCCPFARSLLFFPSLHRIFQCPPNLAMQQKIDTVTCVIHAGNR